MQPVKPAPIILFEGILALYDAEIRSYLDLKIFVNTDDDVRLGRRVLRDIRERGRTLQFCVWQYFQYAKPGYAAFIKPTMKYADIIIPGSADTKKSVDLLLDTFKYKILHVKSVPQGEIKPVAVPQPLKEKSNANTESIIMLKEKENVRPEKEKPMSFYNVMLRVGEEKETNVNRYYLRENQNFRMALSHLSRLLVRKLLQTSKLGEKPARLIVARPEQDAETVGKLIEEAYTEDKKIIYFNYSILSQETVAFIK
jgi:hypothetical protein